MGDIMQGRADAADAMGASQAPGSPRRRRPLRAALVTVAVLVLVGVLALFGVMVALNHKLDTNVRRAGLMPGQSSSSASADPSSQVTENADGSVTDASGHVYVDAKGQPIKVPVGYGSATSQTVQQPSRPATAKNSLNFLVIGSDTAGGERGRSDVMILAHVSDDRKRIDLIHFPRDLWTDVPGVGAAKLNAAYATGGAPRLVETIQPMIGVPIDHVAIVDFTGFQQMTDAIGGVDIAGQHYNGTQALAWVRERHSLSQGDISRGQRQMTFVQAVLLQALKPEVLSNPAGLNRYLDAATKAMTVDEGFTTSDIRSLALQLRDVRSGSIFTRTAPWTGVGTAGSQSIVVPAPEQMGVLRTALQHDAMAGYVDNVSPTHGFSR